MKNELNYLTEVSDDVRVAFDYAASFWNGAITTDHTVVIDVSVPEIDGPGRTLGQAGPTAIDRASRLPVRGRMLFDRVDMQRMIFDRTLVPVILHEMSHVHGSGTLWEFKELVLGGDTQDPRFKGEEANAEYEKLLGDEGDDPPRIPLANTGGPGTFAGHWRERVFGPELLTGYVNAGHNPLSRMSLASLEDLGWEVDYEFADAFALPNAMVLQALSLMGSPSCSCKCPEFEVIDVV